MAAHEEAFASRGFSAVLVAIIRLPNQRSRQVRGAGAGAGQGGGACGNAGGGGRGGRQDDGVDAPERGGELRGGCTGTRAPRSVLRLLRRSAHALLAASSRAVMATLLANADDERRVLPSAGAKLSNCNVTAAADRLVASFGVLCARRGVPCEPPEVSASSAPHARAASGAWAEPRGWTCPQ